MSAIAGDGMQREVHAVAAKAGIDSAHRLIRGKVVPEGGKVDDRNRAWSEDIPELRLV